MGIIVPCAAVIFLDLVIVPDIPASDEGCMELYVFQFADMAAS